MSEPRDVIDDKFGDFPDEPSELPAAPSRPYDPGNGRSIAETIDRIGVAEFLRHMERTTEADQRLRHEEQQTTNRRIDLLTGEVRDGFKTLSERILPTLERIERVLTDHNTRLVEGEQRTRSLEDRMHAHERQIAENTAAIAKLKQAAATRLRKK